jgi:hypothetical protein
MHFILAESMRGKESNLNRWHGWFVAGWCALLAYSVCDTSSHAQEQAAPRKLLVIITGESNAGGYALNTDAKPAELAPRKSVKILNNETLKFEDLDIGENNILGHAGLETTGTHSFELELANLADKFPAGELPAYLLKTGQGGSRIAQWAIDRPYYATFLERLHAAQKSFDGVEVEPVVYFTLGINDALDGTKVDVWKPAVKEHFVHLRKELGSDTPIVMTRLMKQFAPYNAAIEEICAEVPHTYSVDTLDIPLRDPYHWNYAGMKRITNRMFDMLRKDKLEKEKSE